MREREKRERRREMNTDRFSTFFVGAQQYNLRLVIRENRNKCGKVSVHLSLSNSIYTQCMTVYDKFTYNIAFFILEHNK